MKRIVIYPYKMGSESARALQEEFKRRGYRCKRVLPNGRYVPKRNDVVINWGNSNYPNWPWEDANLFPYIRLNRPSWLKIASNKLLTFEKLREFSVSIPEFTTDRQAANEWANQGTVFARSSLNGHSGKGILELVPDSTPSVPLYVRYIKKAAEYRVHVMNGQVIDVQQKRKRRDYEGEINTKVRSYSNGWVFCRDNVDPPRDVLEQSVRAVAALGLDFGAVDVIYNNRMGRGFVLEVNTAPGLEGQTVVNYVNAFVNLIENFQ